MILVDPKRLPAAACSTQPTPPKPFLMRIALDSRPSLLIVEAHTFAYD